MESFGSTHVVRVLTFLKAEITNTYLFKPPLVAGEPDSTWPSRPFRLFLGVIWRNEAIKSPCGTAIPPGGKREFSFVVPYKAGVPVTARCSAPPTVTEGYYTDTVL